MAKKGKKRIKTSTGKKITVSSKVRVGKVGSKRQVSFCARTAKIKGNWKSNPDSKNNAQRYRWKCPPVKGEKRGRKKK